MTDETLVSTLLVPIAGGLLVGFLAGLVTGILATLRWVARRRERGQAVPIYTDDNNPRPGHVPWRGREHLSRLGWTLAVLGILGFLAGSISVWQSNATASCLSEFNGRWAAVQRERADAAELDRVAVDRNRAVTRDTLGAMADLLTVDVGGDQAAWAQRRDGFVQKLRDNDGKLAEIDQLTVEAREKRAENPLPPEPDC